MKQKLGIGYVVTRPSEIGNTPQFWRDGKWTSTPPVGLFTSQTQAERIAAANGGSVEQVRISAVN